MPQVIEKTKGREQGIQQKEMKITKGGERRVRGKHRDIYMTQQEEKAEHSEQNGEVQPTETCTQGLKCAFCCCKMKTVCSFA